MEGVHVLMPVRHFAYRKQLPPKPSISIENITANIPSQDHYKG